MGNTNRTNNRASGTNRKSATAVALPRRDSRGRFISSNSRSTNTSKSRTSTRTVVRNSSKARSSFIQSMTVSGSNVNVVMTRNPKIVYTFKPTAAGMKAVQSAINSGGSLGNVYHTYLKNRELSRTIYV